MRAALQPPRADDTPPAWLLPHQLDAWRRGRAALARFGCVLIAEDVGRGKTWIALALASTDPHPVTVVAPAVLESQWRVAAASAGVRIDWHSVERVSRGMAPPARPVVIIDEAHRFRNHATHRVACIAPWLVGRRAILCTATPIVNCVQDLCALLDLVLPDDALAWEGVASIAGIRDEAGPPACLDRLIVRTAVGTSSIRREVRALGAGPAEECRAAIGVGAVGTLALSRSRPIARLVRSTLLDALASSDAAFVAALRRYRALLAHARDAGGASRSVLRRFAGAALEQTALWSLIDDCIDDGDLAIGDLPRVEQFLDSHVPADHAWMADLRAAIDDDIPTVCFTRHHATAGGLRRALGDSCAWISGTAAGVGAIRLARSQVLRAFGPQRGAWTLMRRAPRILITTDVAAEGLDLQGAGRVVHVDLPWTAMRVEQREGRLCRLGQQHDHVAVIVREPAAIIEERLAPRARVARKAEAAERWLGELVRTPPNASSYAGPAGVVIVRTCGADIAMMLLEVRHEAGRSLRLLTWRDGTWVDGAPDLDTLLSRAASSPPTDIVSAAFDLLCQEAISKVLTRPRLATTAPAVLVARLHRLATQAARRRDASTLAHLDRVLRFSAHSQSRGGRMLLERLAGASDAEILRVPVPDRPQRAPATARVVAAVVFRSGSGMLR